MIFTSQLSTKLFDYNGKSKTFVAEASELPENFAPGNSYSYGKYLPAITLISEKTGAPKVFFLKETDVNREGEIQGWNFYSADGLKALIIND